MQRLTPQLTSKLTTFGQRVLVQGELFLLAKAIADSLPLAPQDTDNIKLYTLTHRRYLDEVVFTLNEYTYLDAEAQQVLKKLVDELTLWRFNMAYKPPITLFKGDATTVIDDMSNLGRYVEMGYLCSVGDIVTQANWTYTSFVELCTETKLQVASQPA